MANRKPTGDELRAQYRDLHHKQIHNSSKFDQQDLNQLLSVKYQLEMLGYKLNNDEKDWYLPTLEEKSETDEQYIQWLIDQTVAGVERWTEDIGALQRLLFIIQNLQQKVNRLEALQIKTPPP